MYGGFNKSKVYGSANGRDKKFWLLTLKRGGRYREVGVSGASTVRLLTLSIWPQFSILFAYSGIPFRLIG